MAFDNWKFWPWSRHIVLEIDELAAERLGIAAVFRSAPKEHSKDWNHKSVLRLQRALSDGQARQDSSQVTAGVIPLALTEGEWKAVGRLCLTLGERPENKWARTISNRIFADAVNRGKLG